LERMGGMMKKYTLTHERENCIGCGACTVIASKFWEMNDDGKSDIVGGAHKPNGVQEKIIDQKDFDINLEAAESCPVEVIHIVDNDKKKKII
jgi:ferredoxin